LSPWFGLLGPYASFWLFGFIGLIGLIGLPGLLMLHGHSGSGGLNEQGVTGSALADAATAIATQTLNKAAAVAFATAAQEPATDFIYVLISDFSLIVEFDLAAHSRRCGDRRPTMLNVKVAICQPALTDLCHRPVLSRAATGRSSTVL
jgi:hypothetical protein